MNYLPNLVMHYKNMLATGGHLLTEATKSTYQMFLNEFESERCKRLIFDARQAKVFDDMGHFSAEKKPLIHPPFNMFYCEFTEPVYFKSQEPGHHDRCRAFLYHGEQEETKEALEENHWRKVRLHRITFFLEGEEQNEISYEKVDRTWAIAPEGYPLGGVPPEWIHVDEARGNSDISSHHHVTSDALPEWARKHGTLIDMRKMLKHRWWEETCIAYTELVYWIFAYTMAKSVRLEPVAMTRQMRRALEREGKVPNPWHVVKVEPRFKQGTVETVGEVGSQHSYRYDVIGHLRFGKHKKKDGSYSETVEWIDGHQRGLQHELYIPKTYEVEAGKKVATHEMNSYINQPIKTE